MNPVALAGSSKHRASAVPAKTISLPGSASTISTPNVSAFQTTDLDVRIRFAPTTWPPAANVPIAAQNDATNGRRWAFFVLTSGALSIALSTNGTSNFFKSSTATPTVSAGTIAGLRCTVKVNNGASGYDVKFYTTAQTDISLNTGWTQLGSTVTTATAITLHSSTGVLELGLDSAGNGACAGAYERLVLMDSIAGSVVADFNATLVNKIATRNPTTYTDTTTRVWAATGTDWDWLT